MGLFLFYHKNIGGTGMLINSLYAKEYCDSVGFAFLAKYHKPDYRKPVSAVEENGVFFTILKWIDEHIPEEEDLRAVYDNIHGWRENVFGGSFNPDEVIPLYDPQNRLVLSDFILDGNLVLAEITDNKYGKEVGYIVLV